VRKKTTRAGFGFAYRRDWKGFRIQVNFLHVKVQGGHVGGGLSRGVKTGIQRVVKEE